MNCPLCKKIMEGFDYWVYYKCEDCTLHIPTAHNTWKNGNDLIAVRGVGNMAITIRRQNTSIYYSGGSITIDVSLPIDITEERLQTLITFS